MPYTFSPASIRLVDTLIPPLCPCCAALQPQLRWQGVNTSSASCFFPLRPNTPSLSSHPPLLFAWACASLPSRVPTPSVSKAIFAGQANRPLLHFTRFVSKIHDLLNLVPSAIRLCLSRKDSRASPLPSPGGDQYHVLGLVDGKYNDAGLAP